MWVEIYERGERMYANLITGECQWDAPHGAAVKQASRLRVSIKIGKRLIKAFYRYSC